MDVEYSKRIGAGLIKAGVIKKHKNKIIKLQYGIQSDVSVNCQSLYHQPRLLLPIGEMLGALIQTAWPATKKDPVYICGVPPAGIIYATLAVVNIGDSAYPLSINNPNKNKRVVFINDIINGINPIIINEINDNVLGVVGIVDRRKYDIEKSTIPPDLVIADIPVPVHSLCNISDLFFLYRKLNY